MVKARFYDENMEFIDKAEITRAFPAIWVGDDHFTEVMWTDDTAIYRKTPKLKDVKVRKKKCLKEGGVSRKLCKILPKTKNG